jgi:hypothetical protein
MDSVADEENLTRPLPRRTATAAASTAAGTAAPAGAPAAPRPRPASELTVVGRFYEVHKYTGSRWELAVVCDDKESAISEAKSILENSKISVGVRVLRVIAQEHNKTKDVTFVEQTIFRQSPVDEHNAEASARLMRAWQEVEAARKQRRLERIHDQIDAEDEYEEGERWQLNHMRLILGLTVVAWIVVLAMFLVHQNLL